MVEIRESISDDYNDPDDNRWGLVSSIGPFSLAEQPSEPLYVHCSNHMTSSGEETKFKFMPSQIYYTPSNYTTKGNIGVYIQRKHMKDMKKEERPLIQCGSTVDGVNILLGNNIVPISNSASGAAASSSQAVPDRKRRRDNKSCDASCGVCRHDDVHRAKVKSIIASDGDVTMGVNKNANMFAMVVVLVFGLILAMVNKTFFAKPKIMEPKKKIKLKEPSQKYKRNNNSRKQRNSSGGFGSKKKNRASSSSRPVTGTKSFPSTASTTTSKNQIKKATTSSKNRQIQQDQHDDDVTSYDSDDSSCILSLGLSSRRKHATPSASPTYPRMVMTSKQIQVQQQMRDHPPSLMQKKEFSQTLHPDVSSSSSVYSSSSTLSLSTMSETLGSCASDAVHQSCTSETSLPTSSTRSHEDIHKVIGGEDNCTNSFKELDSEPKRPIVVNKTHPKLDAGVKRKPGDPSSRASSHMKLTEGRKKFLRQREKNNNSDYLTGGVKHAGSVLSSSAVSTCNIPPNAVWGKKSQPKKCEGNGKGNSINDENNKPNKELCILTPSVAKIGVDCTSASLESINNVATSSGDGDNISNNSIRNDSMVSITGCDKIEKSSSEKKASSILEELNADSMIMNAFEDKEVCISNDINHISCCQGTMRKNVTHRRRSLDTAAISPPSPVNKTTFRRHSLYGSIAAPRSAAIPLPLSPLSQDTQGKSLVQKDADKILQPLTMSSVFSLQNQHQQDTINTHHEKESPETFFSSNMVMSQTNLGIQRRHSLQGTKVSLVNSSFMTPPKTSIDSSIEKENSLLFLRSISGAVQQHHSQSHSLFGSVVPNQLYLHSDNKE